jgi:hypothetical protein
MITSLRTGTQAGALPKAIPMPKTSKAIRKPGKSGPAVFALPNPGPQLRDFTKKISCKAKPSASRKPTTWLTHRGFCEADFFGASPVASALDLRTGRDPDTQTSNISSPFRSYGSETGIFNSFSKEQACRINFRQVKQNWKSEMRLHRDKPGNAVGRPSRQPSLLSHPGATSFYENGATSKHEEARENRAHLKITVRSRV